MLSKLYYSSILNRLHSQFSTSHSPEAVDIVAAGFGWASRVVFVALLHVLEHLAAIGASEVVTSVTEVGAKETCKTGYSCSFWDKSSSFDWVGRSEKNRGHDGELLHVRVLQIAD